MDGGSPGIYRSDIIAVPGWGGFTVAAPALGGMTGDVLTITNSTLSDGWTNPDVAESIMFEGDINDRIVIIGSILEKTPRGYQPPSSNSSLLIENNPF